MARNTTSSNGKIGVNTQNVRMAAQTLTSENNALETAFDSVQNAMRNLGSSWNGRVSDKVMTQFNKEQAKFKGSGGRKAVMDSYISFLEKNVATDYETTEGNNTNLAELFK